MSAENQAREFLAQLYDCVLIDDQFDEDVEVEIRSLASLPGGQKRPRRSYTSGSTLGEVLARAGEDLQAGADVYYGVHLRTRGSIAAGDGSVAYVVAAIADIDCTKNNRTLEEAIAAVDSAPCGPPSMLVSSGGGLHAYWLYDEAVPVGVDEPNGEKWAAQHRKACAWLRSWICKEMGPGLCEHGKKSGCGEPGCRGPKPVADDMSTLDRILRLPGTYNLKPEYRDGGRPAQVRMLRCEDTRYALDDILEWIEVGFNVEAHSGPARRRQRVEDLPTSVSGKVIAALQQAGINWDVRTQGGHVAAVKLYPCIACGQSDGGCYVHPSSGTLRTFHQTTCPAAGQGIRFDEWVERYIGSVPAAEIQPEVQAKAKGLAAALEHFIGEPGTEVLTDAEAIAAAFGAAVWVDEGSVAHLPKSGPNSAGRGVASCAPPAGDYLIPLCDAEDQPRQGVWWSTGHMLPGRVAFTRRDDVVAGGIMVAGSPKAASTNAVEGLTLYLTFSARDYLTLVGLLVRWDRPGVVLGLLEQPRKVLAWLAARWTDMRQRPGRVDFVGGDPELVDMFRGVCGCVWHPGALVETAETEGEAVLRRRLTAEPVWRVKPPVYIHECSSEMQAMLRRGVMYATSSTGSGKPPVVITTPPPGSGKSYQAQKLADQYARGELTIPIRGRRPKGWPADKWPPVARAVAFTAPSIKLAEEKQGDHLRLGLASPATLHTGALNHCVFRENVADTYQYVGRRGVCGVKNTPNYCEQADLGCPGADHPKSHRGEVGYLAEAMAPHMAWDLVFMDEGTSVIHTHTADHGQIRTLFAGTFNRRSAAWRTSQNPDAVAAAELFSEVASKLSAAHGADVGSGRVKPYDRRVYGDELCRMIDGRANLWAYLDLGFDDSAIKPPAPTPNEVRAGSHIKRHLPHLGAWRAMKLLRLFYRQQRKLDEVLPIIGQPAAPPVSVALVLHPQGGWSIEAMKPKLLPDAPTVVLNATGRYTAEEWKVAFPDRRIKLMGVEVWGEPPASAVYVESRKFSKSAMMPPGHGLLASAATTLRRVVLHLAEETRKYYPRGEVDGPLQLGLITYKAAHDAIVGAKSGRVHDVISGLRRELKEDLDAELTVGYFGLHHVGTNIFNKAHGFAVVGFPRPNMGAIEAECQVTGLDPAEVTLARTEEMLIQAMYRPRFTRRARDDAPVILYAGERLVNIPGVVWKRERLAGRSTTQAMAFSAVHWCAAEYGVVGPTVFKYADWSGFGADISQIPRSAFDTATRDFMSRRGVGWASGSIRVDTVTRGRPGEIYARSIYDAAEFAAMLGTRWLTIEGLPTMVFDYLMSTTGKTEDQIDEDLAFLERIFQCGPNAPRENFPQ